jgi:hypothetical protein
MRLINYGAGEIADRLTILKLKILFGKAAGRDVSHFEREQSQLLPKMTLSLTSKVFEATVELAAVNSALWHAEDDLRALRPKADPPPWDPVKAAEQLAFRIQALNDRRAELVALINTNTGEQLGDEKVI